MCDGNAGDSAISHICFDRSCTPQDTQLLPYPPVGKVSAVSSASETPSVRCAASGSGCFRLQSSCGVRCSCCCRRFQTQDTIRQRESPQGTCRHRFSSSNAHASFAQLNLQLFRLNHFQLGTVNLPWAGRRCRGGKAQDAGHCQNKRLNIS